MTLLLTEKEAAEHLRLSTRKLREFRQSGELEYFRIGNAIRYTLTDLQNFIESQRQCSSIKGQTAPIGGADLQQTVINFASAQKKKAKQKRD